LFLVSSTSIAIAAADCSLNCRNTVRSSTCQILGLNSGACGCSIIQEFCNNACVPTESDINNCGSCGTACLAANGVPTCNNGACGLASCNAGYANCNGVNSDGCEVNLKTSASNCGACGQVCLAANGVSTCTNGACGIASCNAGYANCNGVNSDGCEVNLMTSASNCGACGQTCSGGAQCVNGACVAIASATTSWVSEGRTVLLYKTSQCQDLTTNAAQNFCQNQGLQWFLAKSQADAQLLITNAYNQDLTHTWIQIHRGTYSLGGLFDSYSVAVDSASCVSTGTNGWVSIRKWACSYCDTGINSNRSCCWDTGHPYDWFACQVS